MFDSTDILEEISITTSNRYCIIHGVVDERYRSSLQKVCEVASLANYVFRCSSNIEEI